MRTLRRLLLCLTTLYVLGATAPLLAQGGRAEINGTVTDAQKAVLPGVTVTVTNEETGLMREAITDGAGRYVIPQLLPGPYTIKADLSGFQPMTRSNMVVRVGEELTVPLTLSLAGVTETLVVTAEAPLVESTSNRIGTNITSSEIDSLPSANRSQFSLMQTIPGLVPTLQVGSFEADSSARTARRPPITCSSSTARTTTIRAAVVRRVRRRGCRSTRWPSTRCRRISTAPSTAVRPA